MNSFKKINRRAGNTLDRLKRIVKKLIPVFILIPVILLINFFLTIKKINCTFNLEICPPEIQAVVGRLQGTNSLFVNQKELFTFIKAVYPLDKINVSYRAFNTLNITIEGTSPFLLADVFLVNKLPTLSMDTAPSSTDSAGWWTKPTEELKDFVQTQNPLGFDLWENGSMTSVATGGGRINYIFTEKPTPEAVSSIYKMTKLINKYLDVEKIFILGHRSFLYRPDQPDIIVSVPFDEGSLVPALQSMSYLATIKKDAKVIDLSFKNPIIR